MKINKIKRNRKIYKGFEILFVIMIFVTLPTIIMPFFFGMFALAMHAASRKLKQLEELMNYRFYEIFNSEDLSKTDFLYLMEKESMFHIQYADGENFKTEHQLTPIQKEYLQIQKSYDIVAPLYLNSEELSIMFARSAKENKEKK